MKEWWDPFTWDAEQRFDKKVKCQTKQARQARQGQIPHFKEQKPSQMPWYAWREWGVLAYSRIMYHSSPLGASDLVSKQYFFRVYFSYR